MKFVCTKENLQYVLSLVTPLTGKNTNLPILNNLHFVVSDSKVEVVATNLEVAVRAVLRAKIEKTGAFTVPAKTFSDYVHLLSDNQVEVEMVDNELLVTSGSSRTKIKGTSADEYPVIPDIEETHGYTISAPALKHALAKTVIAVAKNEIRPELSGVYFGFFTERYSGLLLAATDSYRLAETRLVVEQGTDVVQSIVPARAIFEMIRLLTLGESADGESKARLWVSENQIALRYDGFEMTARLIDGRYPDYAQIIPANFKTIATFPTDVMVNKIKAASLFATSGVNAVSFDLNAEGKTVGVSSTSTQTGEHSSEVDADVQGEENSILLNFRYVIDGLQQMETDEVGFKVNSGDSPCLFQPKNSADYLYIVMPIRQ